MIASINGIPPGCGVVICLVCLQGQGILPLERVPFAKILPHPADFSAAAHHDGPLFEPVFCPGSGAQLRVLPGDAIEDVPA